MVIFGVVGDYILAIADETENGYDFLLSPLSLSPRGYISYFKSFLNQLELPP